ncbi:DUF2225 domain-containing protein [Marinifilum caeruleilacunae]|nr:DUF2225 domain-containing protein [Marinifilum caeruleilacunae]
MKKLLLILFLMITTSGAFADTYYQDSLKCPLCDKIFEITEMGSMSSFGSTYDFQKQGAVGDYYKLMVKSCPCCRFSGYTSDFLNFSNHSDTINLIKHALVKYDTIEMTDITECELAADLYKCLGRSKANIGQLYLNASYLLRSDSTKTNQRIQMQDSAAVFFIKALSMEEFAPNQIATIEYLIAEMYRRTGKFEKAIVYYDKAINNKEQADWIKEIATKQRILAIKEDDNNEI